MNITHLEPLVYDYSQITDATMRTLAQRAADEIKPRLRRAADDIVVIGQRLAVVRQYLPHGQWKSWIETEFGMGDETARRFIGVATRFADKSLIMRNLTPTALYMLAAPNTPDEAIAEVESLVVNGYTPTVAETKQIITTVRAGLVPAPVVPAPGKLLVDWTDEDWAGHQAEIDAAVLEVADVPAAQEETAPTITGFERVKIARAWLGDYRSKDGLGWRELTDTQITHANSPCYQEFCKANPGIYQPKIVLSSALFDLRQSDRKGSQTPADLAPTPTPADSELNHWRCLRCKYVSATAGKCPRCGSGSWAVVSPTLAVSPSDDKNDLSAETQRERRIAQAQSLPARTYNVILADPPWQYNNTGVNGAAANHYNTMSLGQLGGLLRTLEMEIADNAVLFLWVTNPMLADAFDLINNWGFTYKTNMVWVKDRVGTGFYVRGMHELLLICTKGAMTPINMNITPPITSVISAPTQEHSRKPDQVHDLIERLYPNCNYIELFARRQRAGWDVWGNEVNQ